MDQQLKSIGRKLSALNQRDPRCSLFGARKHRYRLKATITESDVQAFEARHSIQLPPGYRQFILQIGNGGAGPYYGLESLTDESYLGPDESLLRVAEFGCGVWMNLVVSGNEYGNIWVDDRCNDAGLYPDTYFGNEGRLDFLSWYQLWLDTSLAEAPDKTPVPADDPGIQDDSDGRVRDLHAEAVQLLTEKHTDKFIIDALMKKGILEYYAEMILENAKHDKSDNNEFYKHLFGGTFVFMAAAIMTFGTYSVAVPGGIYFIFWGLMVSGIIMIIRAFLFFRK